MSAGEPKVALFVPTYNVEGTVVDVLARIPSEVIRRLGFVYVIDNGSQDRTIEAIRGFASSSASPELRSRLRLFRNASNYSLGGSTIVAFRQAIEDEMDYVICMHSDGQADPSDLARFWEHFADGPDFVFGSRLLPDSRCEDYSRARLLFNHAFAGLQQLLLRAPIRDIGSFIAFRLSSVSEIPYVAVPSDMGYHPLLVLSLARLRKISYREFPISWGKVESSNVNPFTYALRHLVRLARFAIGDAPKNHHPLEHYRTSELQLELNA